MTVIVHTPTSDLKSSLDFYKKLDFCVISEKKPLLVSDGKVQIEINPDRFARAGITLYREGLKTGLDDLKKISTILETQDGYLLNAPSGTWVYLKETKDSNDFNTVDVCTSVLGNFSGISIETIAFDQSVSFWEILGFQVIMGSRQESWISLKNENGFIISLMKALTCPHLFFNPSMTYFNGKNNLSVIKKIRELEVPITEEITQFNPDGIADNILIRDPGGLAFFIFNDG